MTALLTLTILIVTARAVHLYPFGNYTTLYTDGDQYLGFLTYYSDLLRTDNNLFYSWGSVLGGNMLPTAAYYCFSPINILLFLFRDILLGIFVVTVVKILMASIVFCVLINERCDTLSPVLRVVLSTAYGLSGYMIFFIWNSTWMDGVIALPLVVLGLYRLVEDRFSAIYILALAYAIVANFYIGFMVCLASVCFYVVGLLFSDARFVDGLRRSGLRYLTASLIGGGLGMFIVIPGYLGMPEDRQIKLADAFRDLVLNLRPVDMISGLLTGRMEEQSANYPILYAGGVTLLMCLLLYLFDGRVRRKKRAALIGLLVMFYISFYFSMTNQLWHGGTKNAWFNYRYSFVLIFVFLYTAAHAIQGLKGMAVADFQRAIAVDVVLLIWILTETQWSFDAKGILVDVMSAIAGMLLCLRLVRGSTDQMRESVEERGWWKGFINGTLWAEAGIAALIVIGTAANANLVLTKQISICKTAEEFFEMDDRMEEARNLIHDDGFYRMEKTWNWCCNDPLVFRYNGMTEYASSENEAFMRQVRPYGLVHAWHYGRYNPDMPLAMQSFLGIKYLLSEYDLSELPFRLIGETEQGITIQNNPYAMQILMVGRERTDGPEDPFEAMGLLWKSIIDAGTLGDEQVQEDGEDYYTTVGGICRTDSDEDASRLFMSFRAPKNNRLYLYLPEGNPVVTINDPGGYYELDYQVDKQVYCLGDYDVGDEISISVFSDAPGYPVDLVTAAWENLDLFEKTVPTSMQAGITIDRISSSHLRASVSAGDFEEKQQAETDIDNQKKTEPGYGADRTRYVFASIPFDIGWRVKVDGKRVRTEPLLGAFLCFPVDLGEHTIDMVYYPPGFVPGVVISFLSLVALIVVWVREEKNEEEGEGEIVISAGTDGRSVLNGKK